MRLISSVIATVLITLGFSSAAEKFDLLSSKTTQCDEKALAADNGLGSPVRNA